MLEKPMGLSNLDVFAKTLTELAQRDPNVLVVTGDSRGSAKLNAFAETLPGQLIEMGIAEQNLVGVSAGLASFGKKVFVVAPASFLTARALEQIKNDVAYSDHPVKLVGISAGVSYGALGSTHHAIHDFAALQAIHNIDIVVPADNLETREVLLAVVDYPHPIYVRLGKKPMPSLHAPGTTFEIGKAIPLCAGSDVTFIANGETVFPAWQASQLLETQGVSCGVLSIHTLRPLDEQALRIAARTSRALVTVEEHSVNGGLGSRCAAFLMQEGLTVRLKIMGIPDVCTVTGSQVEILAHYGISAEGLANAAVRLLHLREREA